MKNSQPFNRRSKEPSDSRLPFYHHYNHRKEAMTQNPRMKRIFSTFISMPLVFCLSNLTHAASTQSNLKAATPPTQRSPAVRFLLRQVTERNRRQRYTVKAKYPQAVGANLDARLVKLNQELKELISKEVAAFKKDYEAPEEVMGTGGSSFDSSYMITLATNDLVSIAFGISTYFEGAAHPNHNSLVFNYDLNSGRKLNLADLFKPNSNYLRVISGYAIKALKKEMSPDPDTEWIEKGAGASEENYKSWNIKRSGLEITFDPYQVASYAEGEHVVLIPFSVLKDVIDPQGPLARMTGRN
jgi:hypothetical protein